jgi:hypothetical protein
MDTARPALADVWAARVVAWHNRHPLAQRITPAQVLAMGWVDLPFAAPRSGMADRERWVPVFSEPFLPTLKTKAIARWALRHGREVPPQDHDAPVRRVAIDRKLLPEGEHAMVLWLPTAAVHSASGQQRVLLGGVAPFPVLGRRLYSWQRSAVAAAVALLAGTGLAGAGQWWAKHASPQAIMAAAAAEAASAASAAGHAGALGPVAAASAASSASAALAAASAPAAMAAASAAAASASTPAVVAAASAPATAPPATAVASAPPQAMAAASVAAPAPVPAPAASAPAAAVPSQRAEVRPPVAAGAQPPQAPDDRPEAVATTRRAAAAPFPPRKPLLDEASKLEAQREVAAARAARAAAKGLPVYAVVTRRVNKRSDADIDGQLLAGALANVELPRGLRVEPLPAGSGWQAICWPFLNRDDAERLRDHLGSRGVKLEVVAF